MAEVKSASTVELIKNAADAAKSIIIILAILLVIFGHRYVDIILNKYNVTKLDFGGVTIDRGKAIESLAANADKLPQAQAALQKSANDLRQLQSKHEQAVQALEQTRAALTIAQQQLAQGGATESSRLAISRASQAASATIADARNTRAATQAAVQTVEQAAQSTQVAVRELPRPAGGTAGFAVVFGGDNDLASARDEVRRANGRGIDATIFLRQKSYRSVSLYPSRQLAEQAIGPIRRLSRNAAGAYIVNLRSWCPSPESRDGYSDCGI